MSAYLLPTQGLSEKSLIKNKSFSLNIIYATISKWDSD